MKWYFVNEKIVLYIYKILIKKLIVHNMAMLRNNRWKLDIGYFSICAKLTMRKKLLKQDMVFKKKTKKY